MYTPTQEPTLDEIVRHLPETETPCVKPVKLWKLLHHISCKQRPNQPKAILVVTEKLGNHCNIYFQLTLSLQQLLEGSDVDTVRYQVSEVRAIANFTGM